MLGKLLKQEFYATARYFLPIYIIILVLAPLYSLMMRLLNDTGTDVMDALFNFMLLGVFGFAFLIFAIFIATLIMIVVRFYKTTATSEAYLTFTLPVPVHHIILAKTIAAVVWYVVAFFLMIISITSMVWITEKSTPMDTQESNSEIPGNVFFHAEPKDILLFILILLSYFTGAVASILRVFTSIAIGQLFRNHRILISIGVYFAIMIGLQTVSIVFYIADSIIIPEYGALEDAYLSFNYLFSTLKNLAVCAAGFGVTTWIMKKHLNVC